jgi:hypothetical protein
MEIIRSIQGIFLIFSRCDVLSAAHDLRYTPSNVYSTGVREKGLAVFF